MAHEFESGFFVAQPAWHRLGTVLQHSPTTTEAIAQAGLDWRVLEEPICRQENMHTHPALYKQLWRDRDRQLLGTVSYDYTPLQNEEAFRWFDPLLEKGGVELEAAGSLKQGKRVWILARIQEVEAEITPGDWVRPYLLLHNSHDGSTSVWLQFTPIRVVCWNTLNGATVSRFGDLWNRKAICLPHSLNLSAQLEQTRDILDLTRREFQFSVSEYRAMASKEMTQDLLNAYFSQVLGSRSPAYDWSRLLENFERGIGNRGKTLWDAYNAVTEWIDHQRGEVAADRLEASWFGVGTHIRTQAHRVAIELLRSPGLSEFPTFDQQLEQLERLERSLLLKV
jgi:phage/plasmid-like protein (TIGR03299 family)